MEVLGRCSECPGSPLNRISFLRDDHVFLQGAFDHPTTKFIVFKDLSPLIDSPTEIHFVKYDVIKSLIPANPYKKDEKGMLESFNSGEALPGLVFLGLDESHKDGYQYKNYTGAPHFAIDVTPRAPYEEAATEVNKKFDDAGLGFVVGMRAMHFTADVGKLADSVPIVIGILIGLQPPYTQWDAIILTGTSGTHIAEHVDTEPSPSMAAQSESVLPRTQRRRLRKDRPVRHAPLCRTSPSLEQIPLSSWQS